MKLPAFNRLSGLISNSYLYTKYRVDRGIFNFFCVFCATKVVLAFFFVSITCLQTSKRRHHVPFSLS